EPMLADDCDTVARHGSRTRRVRGAPGALLPAPGMHAFHEEVFVVDGELAVGCDARGEGGTSFGPRTYACRPPGIAHGPFASRTGCALLEFMYR
ncbi:MAG: cupin, partial [Burkholderiales bacterium]